MMLTYLRLYSPVLDRSSTPGSSAVASKTRCEYVPVRSAPPSLAPHGFGKPLPYPASVLDRKHCFRSLQWLLILSLLQINRNLLMQRMVHAFLLNKRQESRRLFPLG